MERVEVLLISGGCCAFSTAVGQQWTRFPLGVAGDALAEDWVRFEQAESIEILEIPQIRNDFGREFS